MTISVINNSFLRAMTKNGTNRTMPLDLKEDNLLISLWLQNDKKINKIKNK